jgi:hypothetical protein
LLILLQTQKPPMLESIEGNSIKQPGNLTFKSANSPY